MPISFDDITLLEAIYLLSNNENMEMDCDKRCLVIKKFVK